MWNDVFQTLKATATLSVIKWLIRKSRSNIPGRSKIGYMRKVTLTKPFSVDFFRWFSLAFMHSLSCRFVIFLSNQIWTSALINLNFHNLPHYVIFWLSFILYVDCDPLLLFHQFIDQLKGLVTKKSEFNLNSFTKLSGICLGRFIGMISVNALKSEALTHHASKDNKLSALCWLSCVRRRWWNRSTTFHFHW